MTLLMKYFETTPRPHRPCAVSSLAITQSTIVSYLDNLESRLSARVEFVDHPHANQPSFTIFILPSYVANCKNNMKLHNYLCYYFTHNRLCDSFTTTEY